MAGNIGDGFGAASGQEKIPDDVYDLYIQALERAGVKVTDANRLNLQDQFASFVSQEKRHAAQAREREAAKQKYDQAVLVIAEKRMQEKGLLSTDDAMCPDLFVDNEWFFTPARIGDVTFAVLCRAKPGAYNKFGNNEYIDLRTLPDPIEKAMKPIAETMIPTQEITLPGGEVVAIVTTLGAILIASEMRNPYLAFKFFLTNPNGSVNPESSFTLVRNREADGWATDPNIDYPIWHSYQTNQRKEGLLLKTLVSEYLNNMSNGHSANFDSPANG